MIMKVADSLDVPELSPPRRIAVPRVNRSTLSELQIASQTLRATQAHDDHANLAGPILKTHPTVSQVLVSGQVSRGGTLRAP